MNSEMSQVILNSMVMDNYFEKQVEEKKNKSAEDLRKKMEAQTVLFNQQKEAF